SAGSLANGYNGSVSESAGNRVFFNGIENFTITTGSGNDHIATGDGDDTISTGAGNDNITAGGGNDTINPGDGVDFVNGGLGTDRLLVDYSSSSTNVTGGTSGSLANGYNGSFSDFAGNRVSFNGI